MTGTEEAEPKFAQRYMKLLHRQHDSDRVYLEKMQATIPSLEIRKELAIREKSEQYLTTDLKKK